MMCECAWRLPGVCNIMHGQPKEMAWRQCQHGGMQSTNITYQHSVPDRFVGNEVAPQEASTSTPVRVRAVLVPAVTTLSLRAVVALVRPAHHVNVSTKVTSISNRDILPSFSQNSGWILNPGQSPSTRADLLTAAMWTELA